MLHDSRMRRGALTIALACGALHAQQPAPWTLLRDMEVEGAAFDRHRLAAALARNPSTLEQLRSANEPELLTALAEAVQKLHRDSGHVDATATARRDGGVVHVQVVPGSRYRFAPLVFEGNEFLSAADLREALHTRDGEHGWRFDEGGPAVPTDKQRANLVDGVQRAYAAAGRFGVRVRVRFVPADGTIVPTIDVQHEGHPIVLEGVRLVGEDPEVADGVLAYVSPPLGRNVTTSDLNALRAGLEATGRYWEVAVDVPDAAPERLDPLEVHVRLVDDPPPFDAERQRDVDLLVRVLDGVVAQVRDGKVLRFEAQGAEQSPIHGQVRAELGEQSMSIVLEGLSIAGMPPVPTALSIGRDRLSVALGGRRASFGFDGGVAQLQLVSSQPKQGLHELRWGVGLRRGNHLSVTAIDLHPALAARLLRSGVTIDRGEDGLRLQTDYGVLRIDADGRLLDAEPELHLSEERTLSLRTAPSLDSPGDVQGEAAGVVEEIVAISSGVLASVVTSDVPVEADRARFEAMLDALVRVVVEDAVVPALASVVARPPRDTLVADAPEGGVRGEVLGCCGWLLTRRETIEPVTSLARMIGAMALGDGPTVDATARSIVVEEQNGPIVLWLASLPFDVVGNERAAAWFVARARERWSRVAVWNDIARLASSAPALQSVASRCGARMRAMPELDSLFVDVSEGAAGDVEAFRVAFRYWWSHGGESFLRARMLGG